MKTYTLRTNTIRTNTIRILKLFSVFCMLLSSSLIFTGCPEDLGPISPDVDTSKNYFTADILGDYELYFDAEQVTYQDKFVDGVTIRTIKGNMLLNDYFYDLEITIYDKGDGKTEYILRPNEAKVKFTVSDTELIDEFNKSFAGGTIDLIYNDESRFTGTFKFSTEILSGAKTLTFSNGKFNYNHGITLAANTQTSQ